jgi:hypothetical protein
VLVAVRSISIPHFRNQNKSTLTRCPPAPCTRSRASRELARRRSSPAAREPLLGLLKRQKKPPMPLNQRRRQFSSSPYSALQRLEEALLLAAFDAQVAFLIALACSKASLEGRERAS